MAVSELDGELEQAIETTAAEDFCRDCGVVAQLHDRRVVRLRDLPSGRPAGDAHLGEADLALPGADLCSTHVDRDLGGDLATER